MSAATPDGEWLAPLLDRPDSPPVMTASTLLGWHFVGPTLRDGRPVPPDGEWLTHAGSSVPCVRGLHASVLALDALTYAPEAATHICRVWLDGEMIPHGDPVDKYAASKRRILWRADPHPTLQRFARLCALDVAHLWDMPAGVRDWLETGDEALRPSLRNAVIDGSAAPLAHWAAYWASGVYSPRSVDRASGDAARATEEAAAGISGEGCLFAAHQAARSAQAARLEAMMLALEPGSTG